MAWAQMEAADAEAVLGAVIHGLMLEAGEKDAENTEELLKRVGENQLSRSRACSQRDWERWIARAVAKGAGDAHRWCKQGLYGGEVPRIFL